MRAPWLLLLVGCGPQLADSAGPLKLQTVLLESGRTHEPYTAWLEAAGGDPPYRWEVDSELPPGIVLNPAGALTGIPTQKGTTPVQLRVRDDAGKQVETTVDLEVRWARNAVGCGRSKTGTFTEGASGADWGAVDWQATGGWTSFEIPLPDPEVTRIEIHIGEDWFEAWLALPGTPEGDQDLVANHAYHYAAPGAPIRVDLGTAPDLESYRAYGEPIQLVLIAPYPVPWSIETTCTEGPIIQDIPPSPAFLGDALTVNFSVHGDQGSVSWSQDSPLPDWATFDPETGKIEGTSQEAGVWGFELTAADAAGHTDSVTTGFGVYEHTPLLCDEPHLWQPVEGYLSGALSLEADPRGCCARSPRPEMV